MTSSIKRATLSIDGWSLRQLSNRPRFSEFITFAIFDDKVTVTSAPGPHIMHSTYNEHYFNHISLRGNTPLIAFFNREDLNDTAQFLDANPVILSFYSPSGRALADRVQFEGKKNGESTKLQTVLPTPDQVGTSPEINWQRVSDFSERYGVEPPETEDPRAIAQSLWRNAAGQLQRKTPNEVFREITGPRYESKSPAERFFTPSRKNRNLSITPWKPLQFGDPTLSSIAYHKSRIEDLMNRFTADNVFRFDTGGSPKELPTRAETITEEFDKLTSKYNGATPFDSYRVCVDAGELSITALGDDGYLKWQSSTFLVEGPDVEPEFIHMPRLFTGVSDRVELQTGPNHAPLVAIQRGKGEIIRQIITPT